MPDSQTDVSELAREVVAELDAGSKIGDKFILSRRQLVGIAAGGLSVGALTTLGVDPAAAEEAAGAVGTDAEPVDVFAAGGGTVQLAEDVVSQSTAEGYEITIDGDTYQFTEEE